jgi:hypothetical protein
MSKLSLLLLSIVVLFSCSGCATILGGIIGYQSGELCAGLAIGAAVDFGDDVARAIGRALADVEKEFQKNSRFSAAAGTIELPGIAFTADRMQKVKWELKSKFDENGWTYGVVEKTTETGLFRRDRFWEKWKCATADGQGFYLEVCSRQDENTRLTVTVPADSQADKADVTTHIYQWLEEIVAGKK